MIKYPNHVFWCELLPRTLLKQETDIRLICVPIERELVSGKTINNRICMVREALRTIGHIF